MRRSLRALLIAGLLGLFVGSATAGEPRWSWKADQVLTYQVEHTSQITNTTANGSAVSRNQLRILKRWQVVAVDPAGVATLQLTLAAMQMQTTTPRGDVVTFDSTNPAASTPALREQMAKFVGVPVAVMRVDAAGKVVEVKESKFSPASRYENELPFHVVLPAAAPAVNQGWERAYQITLDPPQGTGEKYAAVQRYTCKSINESSLVVAYRTELLKTPETKGDSIPLLPFQPDGEVTFDLATGRMKLATHQTERELKDHAGPGSVYRFESRYREELKTD